MDTNDYVFLYVVIFVVAYAWQWVKDVEANKKAQARHAKKVKVMAEVAEKLMQE